MRQKSGTSKDAANRLVRGIKRKTREHYSAEEKIRVVLSGLRGEETWSSFIFSRSKAVCVDVNHLNRFSSCFDALFGPKTVSHLSESALVFGGTVFVCGIYFILYSFYGLWIKEFIISGTAMYFATNFMIGAILPSFCFIIPVVMLFRIGDVTAMIATVAFAVVPAIRYTNHGIRQVPPSLIEAAKVSGCTGTQTFFRVQLPVALPEIMLGINQTILMALAMIIICAMIGTRDLEQEVFIALFKADAGRGIVSGLSIAFIGIIADRLFNAWSARARARLG